MSEQPRVLKIKVYHADRKPIFFGYEDEEQVYSLAEKSLVAKPAFLDLLKQRALMPEDLGEVIMHNQMSDEDFGSLDAKGLIPQELKLLFVKITELKNEISQLKTVMASEAAPAAAPEPGCEGGCGDAIQKSEEPLSANPGEGAVAVVLDLVRNALSSPSVLDSIIAGAKGLSEQDKYVLNLVSKHLGGAK
jgi:hypothetical protein